MAGPKVGDPAPDFTLPSTSGGEVTLSAFKGKKIVLLAFFPAAFTGVCTKENCSFSEDYSQFEEADTVVLPISVDNVPSLKEFKTKYSMKQDLLSDFKREVSRKYGTLLEDKFLSRRAYFLIDKKSVVRWVHMEAEIPHRREDSELLQQIRALAK
jgi:peroxiredoxin